MSNTGRKNDRLKPRFDLLPPDALEAVAWVLTFGAQKYGDRNWEKGMDWSRLIGATERHLAAFKRLEDLDPETRMLTIAHAACDVLMLLAFQLRDAGTDDRADLPIEQLEGMKTRLSSMESAFIEALPRLVPPSPAA